MHSGNAKDLSVSGVFRLTTKAVTEDSWAPDIHSEPLKEHIQTYVLLSLDNTKTVNGYAVFNDLEKVPFEFNLSFLTNARPLCTMQRAVSSIAKHLTSASPIANLARRWIFPDISDITNSTPTLTPLYILEDQWIDAGLNAEQRVSTLVATLCSDSHHELQTAVTSIALHHISVPHLVSGPPGTGKTRYCFLTRFLIAVISFTMSAVLLLKQSFRYFVHSQKHAFFYALHLTLPQTRFLRGCMLI